MAKYRGHYAGFAAESAGGRGGTLYRVNTTSSAAGTRTAVGDGSFRSSLRYALEVETGPRIVMFEVSGHITGVYVITAPFLTLACQTSPMGSEVSPFTGIGGVTFSDCAFYIDTHDVVFQHARLRHSVEDNHLIAIGIEDGGDNSNVYKVVMDHVTCTWADGVVQLNVAQSVGPDSVLIADCAFAEPLYDSAAGGINVLLYPSPGAQWTIARSAFLHGWGRNPNWGSAGLMAFYNNAIYNGHDNTNDGDELSGQLLWSDSDFGYYGLGQVVCRDNAIIAGANSGLVAKFMSVSMHPTSLAAGSTMYLAGNTGPGITGTVDDGQWNGVKVGSYGQNYITAATGGPLSNVRTNAPHAWWNTFAPVVIPNVANAVRDYVALHAGARPAERDAADTRIFGYLTAGGGTHFLDWAYVTANYGGLPAIVSRTQALTLPASPHAVAPGETVLTNIEMYLEARARVVEGVGPAPTGRPGSRSAAACGGLMVR